MHAMYFIGRKHAENEINLRHVPEGSRQAGIIARQFRGCVKIQSQAIPSAYIDNNFTIPINP